MVASIDGKGVMSRRTERILAFQVLYGLHFTEVNNRADLLRLFTQKPPPGEGGNDLSEHPFAWFLVEGTWTRLADIDEHIARFSRNWRVERMGRVELTLLRLAMFELICCPDVPPKVVLNEAIELMSRFGDVKSKHFVNGILDAAAREVSEGAMNRDALGTNARGQ
jgi:N utilization substance protein B